MAFGAVFAGASEDRRGYRTAFNAEFAEFTENAEFSL
jgi:hypothetical protein